MKRTHTHTHGHANTHEHDKCGRAVRRLGARVDRYPGGVSVLDALLHHMEGSHSAGVNPSIPPIPIADRAPLRVIPLCHVAMPCSYAMPRGGHAWCRPAAVPLCAEQYHVLGNLHWW